MACCAPKRGEEDNSHRDDVVYVGKQSAHKAGSAAHVESIRQSRAADEEELDAHIDNALQETSSKERHKDFIESVRSRSREAHSLVSRLLYRTLRWKLAA